MGDAINGSLDDPLPMIFTNEWELDLRSTRWAAQRTAAPAYAYAYAAPTPGSKAKRF
jgi:hypothetical protein